MSSSRNNNLSPDCLCTLEAGREGGREGGWTGAVGERGMETERGRENLHALDLFPLIELARF